MAGVLPMRKGASAADRHLAHIAAKRFHGESVLLRLPEKRGRVRLHIVADRVVRLLPAEHAVASLELQHGGEFANVENMVSKLMRSDTLPAYGPDHEFNADGEETCVITHPDMFHAHGCNVYLAAAIRKEVDIPVACIGGQKGLPPLLHLPRIHRPQRQFVDYVTEKTNGGVDITVYWSSSLMDVSTAYTETLEGVSDITLASTGYMPEHFVVDNAINLFYHNSASYADNFDVMHEVYDTVDEWRAEYEGVTVLNFTNAVGASMAILSVKPIRSLDDLKGKTLRCTETSVFELMTELGANPVRMPLSEAYDSMSKGIIDGIVNVPTTFWQQKMGDIAGYMTELKFMAPMTIQSYISDSAMAKLSESQQQAIIDAAHQALELDTLDQLDSHLTQAYDYFKEANAEIITLGEQDLAGLDAAWETICLNKVAELTKQGYDGQGIYDTVREIVAKYE